MKYLFLALALLLSTEAYSKVNCKRHKIYCAIVKLRPSINKKFAMKLSNEIYRSARKHKVKDTMRIVAIMRQESGIKMDARNRSTETKTHTECDEWERCVTTKTIITETTDFGLFQFHINTMQNNNLEIEQVMTDMKFTVNFAIKYLAGKIRMCRRIWKKTPWACYNSANPGKHEEYVRLVDRYYSLIKEEKDSETLQQVNQAKE